MVDFHNPAVLAADGCAYAFSAASREFENTEWIQSCPNKNMARYGWSFHVGLGGVSFSHKISLTLCCDFSWEFVNTFYFEWGIIRGHRYRWTIWVCDLASGWLTSSSSPFAFGSSTPSRGQQPSWP